MTTKTKKITTVALMISISILGGAFPITQSIAFDSFAAFLTTLILGPSMGMIVAFFGHMFSALFSGFPSTLPVHLIIAVLMMICVYAYGYIRNKWSNKPILSKVVSIFVAYLINTPIALFILYPLLKQMVFVLFVPLTMGSLANLLLAEIIYAFLPEKIKYFSTLKNSSKGN